MSTVHPISVWQLRVEAFVIAAVMFTVCPWPYVAELVVTVVVKSAALHSTSAPRKGVDVGNSGVGVDVGVLEAAGGSFATADCAAPQALVASSASAVANPSIPFTPAETPHVARGYVLPLRHRRYRTGQ
jgi:hypothetical protein